MNENKRIQACSALFSESQMNSQTSEEKQLVTQYGEDTWQSVKGLQRESEWVQPSYHKASRV